MVTFNGVPESFARVISSAVTTRCGQRAGYATCCQPTNETVTSSQRTPDSLIGVRVKLTSALFHA
ncbi:MAG: hypothetical protein R2693_02735 [Nocardioidaceae bacterium]|nr:hypothetical protein [Nocardioidaceae bacterium]